MSGTRFASSDMVIDIGAHVGIFSYLCYLKGSRNIWAYEVDFENCRLLDKNLGHLKGFRMHRLAVVRSDCQADYQLVTSGYVQDNTGSCNVVAGGLPYDAENQQIVGNKKEGAQGVLGPSRWIRSFPE